MDLSDLAHAVAEDGITAHEDDLGTLIRLADLDDPDERRLLTLTLDEAASRAARERSLGHLLVRLGRRVARGEPFSTRLLGNSTPWQVSPCRSSP